MSNTGRVFRIFLSAYRWLLYSIFGRIRSQVMPTGLLCQIITNDSAFEKYQGDVVHPCLRYSEQLFRGHHWWLVYTPYFKANALLENPILCYGDSENLDAPTNWQVETLICDTPTVGYNSDPTMFFLNGDLNIFWRENDTERTRKDDTYRATYCMVLSQHEQLNIEKPVLTEKEMLFDKEVSPTIINYNGKYIAYAADIRFKNKRFHFKNRFLDKISSSILKSLSVIELYNEQKSYGIAIYESLPNQFDFKYKKTVKFQNSNKLYNPWHFDFFEHEGKLYAIVQTNQFNADICLALSDDFENFKMYKKPLITQSSINKLGLYKATGIVQNGIFHMYYTAQDKENRSLNKLYYSKYNFEQLLLKLNS